MDEKGEGVVTSSLGNPESPTELKATTAPISMASGARIKSPRKENTDIRIILLRLIL
jgi:hypothetical protein